MKSPSLPSGRTSASPAAVGVAAVDAGVAAAVAAVEVDCWSGLPPSESEVPAGSEVDDGGQWPWFAGCGLGIEVVGSVAGRVADVSISGAAEGIELSW